MKDYNRKLLNELKMYVEYLKKNPNNQFISTYKKENTRKENIKNKIKSSDQYITWLAGFIKKYKNIDTQLIPYNEDILNLDKTNINNLHLFFDIIYEYASSIEIDPITINHNGYKQMTYFVNYEDFYFRIDLTTGQGTSIRCNRVNHKKDHTYINFANIINLNTKNKVKKRTTQ